MVSQCGEFSLIIINCLTLAIEDLHNGKSEHNAKKAKKKTSAGYEIQNCQIMENNNPDDNHQ